MEHKKSSTKKYKNTISKSENLLLQVMAIGDQAIIKDLQKIIFYLAMLSLSTALAVLVISIKFFM